MVIEIMPGVIQYVPKYKPKKEPFQRAECDPLDFATRLKAIREYAKREGEGK